MVKTKKIRRRRRSKKQHQNKNVEGRGVGNQSEKSQNDSQKQIEYEISTEEDSTPQNIFGNIGTYVNKKLNTKTHRERELRKAERQTRKSSRSEEMKYKKQELNGILELINTRFSQIDELKPQLFNKDKNEMLQAFYSINEYIDSAKRLTKESPRFNKTDYFDYTQKIHKMDNELINITEKYEEIKDMEQKINDYEEKGENNVFGSITLAEKYMTQLDDLLENNRFATPSMVQEMKRRVEFCKKIIDYERYQEEDDKYANIAEELKKENLKLKEDGIYSLERFNEMNNQIDNAVKVYMGVDK